VTRRSLEQALPAGERLLLDSSTLIAYLDGREPVSPVATYVIDTLTRTGRNRALVAMVSVMELLVKPCQGEVQGYQHLLDFLTNFPHLSAVTIDLAVAQDAAMFRSAFGMATADALIVASATTHQAGYLVTNDARWKGRLKRLQSRAKTCYLSDHLPWP